MPLYLGIDFGTSGCRACVVDQTGTVCYSLPHSLPAPRRDGPRVEQDPAVWWEALAHLLDQLQRQIPIAEIRAIALDGTSATLMLCDDQGQPLGPALLYNDARATREASRIARHAPQRCGAHGATSSLAKLLYLQAQPGADRASHALHQADWLTGCLTGQFGISDENNALKLGYDVEQRCWPPWLDALGVPRTWLPRVQPAGTPIAPLRSEWQHRWGFRSDTQVISGTTDSTAGFLATGAELPGCAVTSLGSSLVLKVLTEQPVFAPEYGVYSHRLGDRWLVGGASNSGAAVLLKYFTRAQLNSLTPRLQPQYPTGLAYYPLLTPGERFPVQDPALQPSIEPIPEDPVVFLQGLLEGIADIEVRGYRLLAQLGAPYPTEVHTVGGGAHNQAWQQIRQQKLGVPVLRAAQEEAACGAALLALRAH